MVNTMKVIVKILVLLSVIYHLSCGITPIDLRSAKQVDRFPNIDPDYRDVTIPPNIAPLNFCVHEDAEQVQLQISGQNGEVLTVQSASPKLKIPERAWKKLVEKNRGEDLDYQVMVKKSGGEWYSYKSFSQHVAEDEIDRYLTYRLMNPIYIKWKFLGLYQRDLTSYSENNVLHNRGLDKACINCHAFANNSAKNMSLHMRVGPGTGMLVHTKGETKKVDTRTAFNSSAAAYTSWHPSGISELD